LNAIEKGKLSQFQLNRLGIEAIEAGRLGEACHWFSSALQLKRNDPVTLNNLGNSLVSIGRINEGIGHLQKALKLRPSYYDALCNIGRAYRRIGDAQRGLQFLERAVSLQPDNAVGLILLAENLSNLGRQADALPIYVRCVQKKKRFADAIYGLSTAGTCSDGTWLTLAEDYLESNPTTKEEKILIHFAAGKLAQDLGMYEIGFRHFRSAKQNQGFVFDIAGYEKRVLMLKRVFSTYFFDHRKGWGDPRANLVFIVGMPRSGTTLTEQVLAAHPRVHGAGELPFMTELANELGYEETGTDWFARSIQSLDILKVRVLAKKYADRITIPVGTGYHVDKMPHNFEQVGLIKLLFPNARIIHCVRDPIDTCLSCYTNFFNAHHGYTSDFRTLAGYYSSYRQLMDHWSDVFGESIFTMDYEKMIADTSEQTRKLLDYVGVEFDLNCLEPHKADRSVGTISRWQVRQPIYNSSVRRWERYGDAVQPLIDSLADYGVT
jgi:hypothetical protein